MVRPVVLYAQVGVTSADEAKRVLEQYFDYLKNGKTSEILNLITGPLLEKREALLKNNASYGSFLKNYYKNAYLVITSDVFTRNDLLALRASIYFNAHDKSDFIFSFVYEGSNGSLKIYSEEEVL